MHCKVFADIRRGSVQRRQETGHYIGPRLLLMTNRKLHTRYRLIPKSVTSDDFEGPLSTLFQNTFVFRSPPRTFE